MQSSSKHPQRRLARSSGAAAAALALGLLVPSGGSGAAPPADTGSEETAQARAASRDCPAHAAGLSRVSRFQCDVELSSDLLRLSVLYGSEGWSGGRVTSWQELRDEPLFPSIDRGFRESETSPADWQDAEARMRLEGKSRGLGYRAEYGFFQDGFFKEGVAQRPSATMSVRSGGRFEASWKLGFVQPKLELSRFWKQRQVPGVDEEARSKARLAVDIPLPHLPLLTLSVGRESRALTSTLHQPVDAEVNEVLTDVASATLWYGRPRWEASLTSSYFKVAQDLDDASDEAVLHDHVVSWTYRPTAALSLVPLLEYTETNYARVDYATTSALASLGVYYASSDGSRHTYLYASYLAGRDSLGYADTRSVDLAAGFEQDISRFFGLAHGRQTLGFRFTVGRWDDLVYRDASTFTYGAFFQIRILP